MKNKSEYAEKFKDPRWQKKRLEVFERDEFRCQSCQDDESPLHIHHLYYLDGKDPWEYPNEALLTLCMNCHEEEGLSMPKALKSLILAIKKKGFLSSSISEIAMGFDEVKIIMAEGVTASIIRLALGSDKIMGLAKDNIFRK